MDKLISLFSQQLLEALKLGHSFSFPQLKGDWKNVLISGLGGSGIGGTIVENYVKLILSVPVVVNKTYDLPAFVGKETLVLICSYSGNTEETIAALEKSIQIGATIACITSGGKIEQIAAENNLPCFKMPGGMPPRACLGYSLVKILFALKYAGLLDGAYENEIKNAANLIATQQSEIQREALAIAQKLNGKTPVIYAADHMEGVAVRWRQQLNENSKVLAWERVVPEMNHNELVGWKDKNNNLAVVFLKTKSDHPRVLSRMLINQKVIEKCTDTLITVNALGVNFWEQSISLIHLGDWVSWYLAELRKVDAVEVSVIDYLKKQLSEI